MTRMGLDLKDILALMGAHTLGRAQLENSGYEGEWVPGLAEFDNEYYRDLVEVPWQRQQAEVPGHGLKHSWTEPNSKTLMLNTDMCLAWDIGDADDVVNKLDCNIKPGFDRGLHAVAEQVHCYSSHMHRCFSGLFITLSATGEQGWRTGVLPPSSKGPLRYHFLLHQEQVHLVL